MANVLEFWAWGEEWSPITVVETGSILTAVYYPHKAGGDLIINARNHPVHCCICDKAIDGTKPHTRKQYRSRAIADHLRQHGKRTRKRNGFIVRMEEAAALVSTGTRGRERMQREST